MKEIQTVLQSNQHRRAQFMLQDELIPIMSTGEENPEEIQQLQVEDEEKKQRNTATS